MPFEKLAKMILPREVIGGHGAIQEVADVFKKITSSNRGIIVTGSKTLKLAGEKVGKILEESGINTDFVIVGSATEENVQVVKEKTKAFGAKVILGIGGGTKIDIAKKSAYDLGLDFISIPTSASHDGVASPRASISKNGISTSVEAAMPAAIIADTQIIVTAPFRFLASGAADVLSNLTALKDWSLAHRLKAERISSSAYSISEFAAKEIINNAAQIKPGLEESVWLVIKQIVFSGTFWQIALLKQSQTSNASITIFTLSTPY
ncbi:MAG: iron-containing alcohol dehydrogenase [Thermoplasmatales archaeon]